MKQQKIKEKKNNKTKQQIRFVEFCAKDKKDGKKIIKTTIVDDYVFFLFYKPNNLAFTYSYYDEKRKEYVGKKIEDSQIRCDICGSPKPPIKLLINTYMSNNKKWFTHALCDNCNKKEEVTIRIE